MKLLVVTGAGIAEKVANSSNPWIYLSIILIVAALLAGRYIFNYLIKLDQSHRDESKKREEKLNEQLDKSIEANQTLSETQKEIVVAINGLNGSVKSLESRMDRFEKKESA